MRNIIVGGGVVLSGWAVAETQPAQQAQPLTAPQTTSTAAPAAMATTVPPAVPTATPTSVPLDQVEVKLEDKPTQEPFGLSPSFEFGLGYAVDPYLSFKPAIGLSTKFKSATGRNIGFSVSTDFAYHEFVFEESDGTLKDVSSTSDVRDVEWNLSLSGSTDITSKIGASITAAGNLVRVNNYENSGGDTNVLVMSPALSFKVLDKTSLGLSYAFAAKEFINGSIASEPEESGIDGAITTVGNRSVFPSLSLESWYAYDPYSLSIYGPLDASTVSDAPKVDYSHSVKWSVSQSFPNPMLPSLSGSYKLLLDRSSTDPNRDLWYSHGGKVGLSQPLWKNASCDISDEVGIFNYESVLSADKQYYKQSMTNTASVGLNQKINDYLNASGRYDNDYAKDNEKNKAEVGHTVFVALTATF